MPRKSKRGRPSGGSSEKTRARLVDAARRLFAARGYDGVGTAEIVGAAGVTAPVLYHHFENKAGLYAAAMTEVYDKMLDRFVAAAERGERFPDKLFEILLAATQLGEEDPTIALFVSSMPTQITTFPELRAITPQMSRVRDFLFRLAKRSPDVGGRGAKPVAQASWVVLSGLGRIFASTTPAERRQYVEAVRQLIHGELFRSQSVVGRQRRNSRLGTQARRRGRSRSVSDG